MNPAAIDTNLFNTSVGVFKRETGLFLLDKAHGMVKERLFFNDVEVPSATDIKNLIGDEKYQKLKEEVENYSLWLDTYISAVASRY